MGIKRIQEAAARAEQMFSAGEAHERPADLIADIIHLCRLEDTDFENELRLAREYVAEEESMDDEEGL